jgi:hypothetical protein
MPAAFTAGLLGRHVAKVRLGAHDRVLHDCLMRRRQRTREQRLAT